MPTIIQSGPQIILSNNESAPEQIKPTLQPTAPPQPIAQPAAQPPPVVQPVVTQTTPVSEKPKTQPTKDDTVAQETELLHELEEVQKQEESIVSKIRKLLSGKQPTNEPTPEKKPETSVTPLAKPAETVQPVASISPNDKILGALQAAFSPSDAAIAAVLSNDAVVERSPDKDGVLISSQHGQVHFSSEDLKQANISTLNLSDIPYAQVTAEPAATAPAQQPVPAPEPLTPTMQKLIDLLKTKPPADSTIAWDAIQAVTRSADGNGVRLTMNDNTSVQISDAELIQAGVTGADVVDLPTATA